MSHERRIELFGAAVYLPGLRTTPAANIGRFNYRNCRGLGTYRRLGAGCAEKKRVTNDLTDYRRGIGAFAQCADTPIACDEIRRYFVAIFTALQHSVVASPVLRELD